MSRKTERSGRAAQLEVRCLAVVFLIIAAVHSVLAAVERVTWPFVFSAACVAGAVVLERIFVAYQRPYGVQRLDAAQRLVREGLAELPRHLTCGLVRDAP